MTSGSSTARRKYRAVHDKAPPKGNITVQALSRMQQHIVNYKGFFIKGYSGRLKLKGPQELLQMALETGLGSKNSQGFGFVSLS
ncbi:MAG: CRISPR-associated endoribonuclease Cas6 [Chloroflexota bacterium]|nr:CRISPR-associated endoribonuclease Cas6 [Chloroflexota bacterium]